jgi:RNA polymerase sigma-70 factor, ECF subfamily
LLNEVITDVFRREHGRAVAVLIRQLGDISLAEECVQEAFAAALERWAADGVPPSPTGWIITTARHRAIDRLRREASRDERQRAAVALMEADDGEEHAVEDDQLRLIFTCCHPALAIEAQLALTLRLVGGLTTEEIARAFLLPTPTVAQRISRAKAKIRDAGIPYRVPEPEDLPARLGAVLAVIYLLFNEGYSASAGAELIRVALIEEAIRLGRLVRELFPGHPEVTGLLALMLLIDARRPARVDAHGAFVPLGRQDRGRWDAERIAEGQSLLRECLRWNQPGVYQIQAAINAVHLDARESGHTDWRQVRALYDRWMALAPSPLVALNRAVVVAEIDGPADALRLVDELDLANYHLFHAVRADLLRRLGYARQAGEAYAAAIARCSNEKEKDHLRRQWEALGRPDALETGAT